MARNWPPNQQKLTEHQLRQAIIKAAREWARTGSIASLTTLKEFESEAKSREQVVVE